MAKKDFRRAPKPVNSALEKLEGIKEEVKAIQEKADEQIEAIRGGFMDATVVFVDLVGSTQFKEDHKDAPETWILRVKQFGELIAQYATRLHGRIVKYIGDEVMLCFQDEGHITDAVSFVSRIADIQNSLGQVTGFPTKVKIAIDTGDVYFLEFDGHEEPDPQGPAVDRCARIARYCEPGTVLTSGDVAKKSPATNWNKVGRPILKGIGKTAIYQLGEATISIEEKVEITLAEKEEFETTIESQEARIEKLEIDLGQAREKNKELIAQIEEGGDEVDADLVVEDEEDSEAAKSWEKVEKLVKSLKEAMNIGGTKSQVARFLFLHFKGFSQERNWFDGKEFPELIERGIVVPVEDGASLYELNPKNLKVERLLQIADSLDDRLKAHEAEFGNDDDLYHYRLSDPDAWEEIIGFDVSSI